MIQLIIPGLGMSAMQQAESVIANAFGLEIERRVLTPDIWCPITISLYFDKKLFQPYEALPWLTRLRDDLDSLSGRGRDSVRTHLESAKYLLHLSINDWQRDAMINFNVVSVILRVIQAQPGDYDPNARNELFEVLANLFKSSIVKEQWLQQGGIEQLLHELHTAIAPTDGWGLKAGFDQTIKVAKALRRLCIRDPEAIRLLVKARAIEHVVYIFWDYLHLTFKGDLYLLDKAKAAHFAFAGLLKEISQWPDDDEVRRDVARKCAKSGAIQLLMRIALRGGAMNLALGALSFVSPYAETHHEIWPWYKDLNDLLRSPSTPFDSKECLEKIMREIFLAHFSSTFLS